MRAPISVIIPTLNAADRLPGCLQSLMEGLEMELLREVIISDGGSDDATPQIADAWGAVLLSTPASRGRQLAHGCVAAKGEWLLVLHADTQLAPGWTGAVRQHMLRQQAGWFRLRFDQGGRMVSRWANLRAQFGLPYGDQGLLLPKDLYASVGGYPEIPLMEDVALARALRGHMQAIDAVAVTSSEKYRKQGWLRRGAHNLLLLLRYFGGADPEQLARAYRVSK